MRKVAGYVRVSSEEQSREGISLDAQRARIVAYCAMRGLDLVELVEDPGVSASKPLKARGHDVRTAGTAGADMVRVAQARARSMVTGTGLLTMSRTGE